MQIQPDILAIRVERRIAELGYYRYVFRKRLSGWWVARSRPDVQENAVAGQEIRSQSTSDQVASFGDSNNLIGEFCEFFRTGTTIAETFWLSKKIVIPDQCAGKPVHLLLTTNAEALFYVDGVVWQGLDENHSEVLLCECGDPGRVFQLAIKLFTGRDRNEKTLEAELALIDSKIEAYRNDLRAVLGVVRSMPDDNTTAIRLRQALTVSINTIDFHSQYGHVDVSTASQVLGNHVQALRQKGQDSTNIDIFLVGNSHIDVAWLWTLGETRQKMGRTTATALRHMEEYPEFHFVQSQAQLYEYLRRDFPELFRRVQEKVREGQWNIVGNAWVEPDCNVIGGESLVRQLLYGKKFWNEHFDKESDVMWLPDTFGYSWALPQILKKSGMRTFVTQKLTWNERNEFPFGHFDWEGIDGTRVRCTFPQIYVSRTFPEQIIASYKKYPSKETVSSMLYLYGYGDGGGGPVREDIEIARRLDDMPGFPHCRSSSIDEALDYIRRAADARAETLDQPIPVWRGELYLEFHRGTLTTHARIKRKNRKCELLLREAELWASLATVDPRYVYPLEVLESAWKKVLLNQFHDIIPGTSIPPVYIEAYQMYEEVKTTAKAVIAKASIHFFSIEKSEEVFTVFNSLSWEVTEWVEIEIDACHAFHLEDGEGYAIPYQITEEKNESIRLGFEATVPAMQSATYTVKTGEGTGFANLSGDDNLLENARFRVLFNDAGYLVSVFDKTMEREWLDGPANVFQTFDDRPNQWEAWDINDWYEQKPLNLFSIKSADIIECGPVRVVKRLVFSSLNGSRIEQDVVLYRMIPRIDFQTRIDWYEKRVLLKTAFPVAVHAAWATYEIQFGSITRPTTRNTSWESAMFEVAAQRWIDLSEGNGGVSLLNDCKYGHDVRGNVMRVTLLRNMPHPDPQCPSPPFLFPDQEEKNIFTDTGVHEMHYAFYPHQADWRNGTVRQAHSFNSRPRVQRGQGKPTGGCRVSDPAIVIDTLKRAEDGNGHILRVYESGGGRHHATISLPLTLTSVAAVDLMERPSSGESAVSLNESQSIQFFLRPFEIRSFRLCW